MKTRAHLFLFSLLICVSLSCQPALGAQTVKYELKGRISREDGKPFREVIPVAILHSNTLPFTTQALVDSGGGFTIRKLPPGIYTLSILVPHAGEMHKTIEIGPSFADAARRIRTSILFGPNPARSHSVSAVELSIPMHAQSAYRKAQDFLSRRKVEQAVSALQEAVRLAPQFWEAWNNLGTIAYQSGHFEAAEGHFREALRHAPGAEAPLVNLGGALLSLGKLSDALTANRQAVSSKPDDPLAHSQLGQNYFRLGQYGEAEEQLKQAKALDPAHFSFPQLFLAQIYQREGDYPAVILELEEFLRLHPDSDRAARVREIISAAERAE